MDDNWLASLKSGDMVAVKPLEYPSYPYRAKVVRTTKTLVVVSIDFHGSIRAGRFVPEKYRRKDGLSVDHDGEWHYSRIMPAEGNEEFLMRAEILKYTLTPHQLDKLSTETLQRIAEIARKELESECQE